MKNAWIIIAIIFILQPIIPVVNYFADYEYISTVLCINKETPSFQCNGKCQLGKELAKDSDQSQPQDSSLKKIEILPQLFFQNFIGLNKIFINAPHQKSAFYYQNPFVHNPHITKIIQPPNI